MLKKFIFLFFIIIFLFGSLAIRKRLEEQRKKNILKTEFRYVLPGNFYKMIASGYDKAIGTFFWLQSLQNMDVTDQKPKKFSFLYGLLNTAALLNPLYQPIYVAGGGFLAVIFRDYKGAEDLFLKGLEVFPENLQIHSYLSMLYMHELNDYDKAAYYMDKASKLPGAPPWYRELSARLYVESQRPEIALKMLISLHQATMNEDLKKELSRKIKLVIIDKQILELKSLAKVYSERYGDLTSIDELVSKGFLKELPRDPFGKNYYLNSKGEFKTPSTSERFRPFKVERQRDKNGND
jgi:tetratricopeptide (TPR) repeat protein